MSLTLDFPGQQAQGSINHTHMFQQKKKSELPLWKRCGVPPAAPGEAGQPVGYSMKICAHVYSVVCPDECVSSSHKVVGLKSTKNQQV